MSTSVVFFATFVCYLCNAGNRLIESDQNIDLNNNKLTSRRNLLLEIEIHSFTNHPHLKGIALITRKGKSWCSGSYITTPTTGTYVLTASHCVWSIAPTPTTEYPIRNNWKIHSLNDLKVEFGVINNQPNGSHGIIACDIADIIINDKYPMDYKHPSDSIQDYALFKLKNCHNGHPTNPFKISDVNIPSKNGPSLTHLKRAGYKGSRTLHVEIHTKYQGLRDGLIIYTGISDSGDSGGPYYDFSSPFHQRIIHISGQKKRNITYNLGIIITPSVHTKIDEMARGNEGISFLIKDCVVATHNQQTCWSPCYISKPTACFISGGEIRLYAMSGQQIPCQGDDKYNTFKYLCGAIMSKPTAARSTRNLFNYLMDAYYSYFYYDDTY